MIGYRTTGEGMLIHRPANDKVSTSELVVKAATIRSDTALAGGLTTLLPPWRATRMNDVSNRCSCLSRLNRNISNNERCEHVDSLAQTDFIYALSVIQGENGLLYKWVTLSPRVSPSVIGVLVEWEIGQSGFVCWLNGLMGLTLRGPAWPLPTRRRL